MEGISPEEKNPLIMSQFDSPCSIIQREWDAAISSSYVSILTWDCDLYSKSNAGLPSQRRFKKTIQGNDVALDCSKPRSQIPDWAKRRLSD